MDRLSINLSELSDKELECLHGDAIRLSQSGTPAQRIAAEQMLPRVGEEISRRIAALQVEVAGKRIAKMAKSRLPPK